MQTMRQGAFIMKTSCGACGGEGEKIKHSCTNCKGSGIEKKKMREEIAIPRGISEGMTIKLSKKGNMDGDLYVKVQISKSSVFAREGNNATMQLSVSVVDAILGTEKEVTTIEGTKKLVKIPQGTQPGDKITVKNEGFYSVNSSSKGDFILTVKIAVPKELTAEQRSIYEKLRAIGK